MRLLVPAYYIIRFTESYRAVATHLIELKVKLLLHDDATPTSSGRRVLCTYRCGWRPT